MQVATGTVIDGKIVVEGAELPEGAVVTVLSRGTAESFSLTEDQENELLEAMAEIERGEFVTLEDLLGSLPKQS
jgi:predicted transcriptional regulator